MNFDNQLLAQQINSLSAKLLKKEKKTEKWGVWSEGNISFGRVGQQDGNLGQDIHSDGITFGIDKKINEDKTIGFAINKSCLLYTSPSPRDRTTSRMPSSA